MLVKEKELSNEFKIVHTFLNSEIFTAILKDDLYYALDIKGLQSAILSGNKNQMLPVAQVKGEETLSCVYAECEMYMFPLAEALFIKNERGFVRFHDEVKRKFHGYLNLTFPLLADSDVAFRISLCMSGKANEDFVETCDNYLAAVLADNEDMYKCLMETIG